MKQMCAFTVVNTHPRNPRAFVFVCNGGGDSARQNNMMNDAYSSLAEDV